MFQLWIIQTANKLEMEMNTTLAVGRHLCDTPKIPHEGLDLGHVGISQENGTSKGRRLLDNCETIVR